MTERGEDEGQGERRRRRGVDKEKGEIGRLWEKDKNKDDEPELSTSPW